ncbi:MAG: hypothetical protein EZS28_030474, partial [Streblomastix strix]
EEICTFPQKENIIRRNQYKYLTVYRLKEDVYDYEYEQTEASKKQFDQMRINAQEILSNLKEEEPDKESESESESKSEESEKTDKNEEKDKEDDDDEKSDEKTTKQNPRKRFRYVEVEELDDNSNIDKE